MLFKTSLSAVKNLLIFSAVCMGLLSACQAPSKLPTSPSKVSQNAMKVKTRSSSFIYLTTIPKEERTVYIATQNDSGSDIFDIKPWLTESFQQKSFTVVDNIDQANVVVRANVLRLGKVRGDGAQALLDSEFGNSTPLFSMTEVTPGSKEPLPNNTALVLDIQYFERNHLIDPALVKPRRSMNGLTDIQLLLLCNTSRWERFQTRIVSIIFDSSAPVETQLNVLAQSAEAANTDIVRGLS